MYNGVSPRELGKRGGEVSIKQHHLDWLNLIDVSGPFLSPKVLSSIFPQGLDEVDNSNYKNLKIEIEDFELNPSVTQVQHFSSWIFRSILKYDPSFIKDDQDTRSSYTVDFPEHNENVSPDSIIFNPDFENLESPGEARVFFKLYNPDTKIDKVDKSSVGWKASPASKVTEAIRSLSIELAIITNGEHWMLVYAPKGQNTSYASWYSNIWFEEKITLRSFQSLLCSHRLFGITAKESLEGMFELSLNDQEELTDQLGQQVLRSVELLVSSIDKIDKDRNRDLLAGCDEKNLYEASVTVMMRLIFMLAAEERDLFFLGESFYDDNYAISTLVDHLQDEADRLGEEVLERRSDAWSRILATFRAVFGGVNHHAMRLPAYGGGLFDPDRFPFLEGRDSSSKWEQDSANPLPINNRTVLYILRSIQYLETGTADARRLSFRALDVEQIGYIYEGLLDHTAKKAKEIVLSLVGAKNIEPEIELSILEKWLNEGEDSFIKEFTKVSKKTTNTIIKGLKYSLTDDDKRLLSVSCEHDSNLILRVSRFYGLLRKDWFGYPVVIHPESVFVTDGEDRRSSGTHYTPKILTEPVVLYTLEPLVYNGPSEGKEKINWKLKTPEEILELKICDIACGSAAFLVQACRYLSERLVEAWAEREKFFNDQIITYPYGLPQQEGLLQQDLIEKDEEKRLLDARRLIVSRCLYGVDKNPLAVEMAKLSMWLITMEKGKPFSFVDHAIKSGDSLIGLKDLKETETRILNNWSLFNSAMMEQWRLKVSTISKLRKDIEKTPGLTISDVKSKQKLLNFIDDELNQIKSFADIIIIQDFLNIDSNYPFSLADFSDLNLQSLMTQNAVLISSLKKKYGLESMFHWFLEFPEVFTRDNSGFDAIVGNPPFKGGKKISGLVGSVYRDYLIRYIAAGINGSADLCAYFYVRVNNLTNDFGTYGLVATNSICQGDTRLVGLDRICLKSLLYRAVSTRKWPGAANVEVSLTWISKFNYLGKFFLDDQRVSKITSYLKKESIITSDPAPLIENEDKSFQGSIVVGEGFQLSLSEGQDLILRDSRNIDVVRPYIGGTDLNSNFDLSPSRMIINFYDWPLERSLESNSTSWSQEVKDENFKKGIVPCNYSGPVIKDYPDCHQILEKDVKPVRTRKTESGDFSLRYPLYEKWWHYADKRPLLYKTIKTLQKVLVKGQVTSTWFWAFTSNRYVIDAKLIAFAFDDYAHFGVLQSELHFIWSVQFMTTMKKDITYSPERLFRTFPIPGRLAEVDSAAQKLYEYREQLMLRNKMGATKLYNLYNDQKIQTPEMIQLRELHHCLDKAVLDSYGWGSIKLEYEYQVIWNKTKLSFTEEVKDKILEKLYLLNKERSNNDK